jgi:hypothetical protein
MFDPARGLGTRDIANGQDVAASMTARAPSTQA